MTRHSIANKSKVQRDDVKISKNVTSSPISNIVNISVRRVAPIAAPPIIAKLKTDLTPYFSIITISAKSNVTHVAALAKNPTPPTSIGLNVA